MDQNFSLRWCKTSLFFAPLTKWQKKAKLWTTTTKKQMCVCFCSRSESISNVFSLAKMETSSASHFASSASCTSTGGYAAPPAWGCLPTFHLETKSKVTTWPGFKRRKVEETDTLRYFLTVRWLENLLNFDGMKTRKDGDFHGLLLLVSGRVRFHDLGWLSFDLI